METRNKLFVAAIAGLVVGYFIGREHLKYQIASAITAASQNLSSSLTKQFARATPTNPTATSECVAPQVKVSDAKENAKTYAAKISLYDFSAKFHQTYEGRAPGVEFKIKNSGDKTISKLQVTVYFNDAAGATIAEDDFYPVLPGGFSTSSRTPLKPGYVWQQERNRFYQSKQVPSEWKEGAATAVITEIEFE